MRPLIEKKFRAALPLKLPNWRTQQLNGSIIAISPANEVSELNAAVDFLVRTKERQLLKTASFE